MSIRRSTWWRGGRCIMRRRFRFAGLRGAWWLSSTRGDRRRSRAIRCILRAWAGRRMRSRRRAFRSFMIRIGRVGFGGAMWTCRGRRFWRRCRRLISRVSGEGNADSRAYGDGHVAEFCRGRRFAAALKGFSPAMQWHQHDPLPRDGSLSRDDAGVWTVSFAGVPVRAKGCGWSLLDSNFLRG